MIRIYVDQKLVYVTTILSPTPSGTENSNKNEHKVIFELQMFSSGDFQICAKLHLSFST